MILEISSQLFSEIGIPVLAIFVGIVGFFLKKSLNDIEKLKDKSVDAKVMQQQVNSNEKHLDEFKNEVYKKFSKIHIKQEKQDEMNTYFKEMLAQINTKLDMILNDKK